MQWGLQNPEFGNIVTLVRPPISVCKALQLVRGLNPRFQCSLSTNGKCLFNKFVDGWMADESGSSFSSRLPFGLCMPKKAIQQFLLCEISPTLKLLFPRLSINWITKRIDLFLEKCCAAWVVDFFCFIL